MIRRRLRWVILLLLCAVVPSFSAQDEGGHLAVQVVGGRLLVRCDLATESRRIPVNLAVELENPASLQLHRGAFQGLRARPGDPVEAIFPGFKIQGISTEPGDDNALSAFTARWSPEMGEVALVGVIGWGVLSRYQVTLDLAEGFLHLNPPRPKDEPGEAAVEAEQVSLDVTRGGLWFPVETPGGGLGMMQLGTGRFDTILDEDLCRAWKHPAGDVGPLELGAIDFARYVAFRPASFSAFHRDTAIGRTGLNLLQHFRVALDPVNRLVRWTETRSPRFPKDDLAYFRAMVSGQAEPVEAWLEGHPESRLAEEASDLLLARRLADKATKPEVLQRAIRKAVETRPEDLRATTALRLMDELAQADRGEAVVWAGEEGIRFGRKDRDSNAVHKIHARLGARLLESGQRREAWRHLLSAAFGMKDDGPVNLNLAKFYEKDGKLARAFARYVYALIKPETGPEAIKGLERVQKAMSPGESLSIDVLEKLVAGKVPGFGVGNKFRPTKENSSNRCVLAMLFTGAHCPPCLGADLAFDGILSHFPSKWVTVLEYHLPIPAPEPLVSEPALRQFDFMGFNGTPVAVFDGVETISGGGPENKKEEIWLKYKEKLLARLKVPAKHEIEAELTVKDGSLRGKIRVKGPAVAGARLHALVVEKGVLFPGRNKVVIHHAVVRGSVFGSSSGVAFRPDADGRFATSFEKSLSAVREELEDVLDEIEADSGTTFGMRPTRLDPEQLGLVIFLQAPSGEILQARQVSPSADEDPLEGLPKEGKDR